jgi:hypothetical protein
MLNCLNIYLNIIKHFLNATKIELFFIILFQHVEIYLRIFWFPVRLLQWSFN